MAQKTKHTMGERLNIRFNRKIKLEFRGARLTSDAVFLLTGSLMRHWDYLIQLHSRKPIVWFHGFNYRSASWHKSRRVVAKVEWYSGDLFPRVGFIVTNMSAKTVSVVRFYNGRGVAEQWISKKMVTH
jgi:hypothetical protein